MAVITKQVYVYDQYGKTRVRRRRNDPDSEIHMYLRYEDGSTVDMTDWSGVVDIEDPAGVVVASDFAIVLATAASGLFKIKLTATEQNEFRSQGGIYTAAFRFDPDGLTDYDVRAVNNLVLEIVQN